MIDDPELWALFRAEAEEQLQLLDSGLLQLEIDACDRATLETVFRSAHSLKGAARMMGAHAIESGAHGFEDALMGAAKHGEALEEATIERLYKDLDALRTTVENAIRDSARAANIAAEAPVSAPVEPVQIEGIPAPPTSAPIAATSKPLNEAPRVSPPLGRTYESDALPENRSIEVSGGDAVISDVEMPNLDGIALSHRIRQQQKYEELPIILVTSLASEADRRRGLEAGANAYITKGDFDQKQLLETLRLLI